MSGEFTKPGYDLSGTWRRYGRYVRIVGLVCLFAVMAMIARPKPEPPRKPVERAMVPKEPFSPEKFEQEMKAREAEARIEVTKEKEASDAQARELAAQGGTWIIVDGAWQRTHNPGTDAEEKPN